MTDTIAVIISICLITGFFGLCARVQALLAEIRRQGEQREQEAVKIIVLLSRIAAPVVVPGDSEDENSRLQAAADLRSLRS